MVDLPKICQERRVLAQPGDAGADVRRVDREPFAASALGERLRLHVVVLLELEVLHHRARLEVHAPLLVALIEEAPAANDLRTLEQRRLIEDHDVESFDFERLRELADEVHLVVEELARVHTLKQKKSDVEILVLPRDAPAGDRPLRVGRIDRRGLEKTLQLGLLFEEVHTYLYKAGAVPCRAPARFASIRYPSVPPRSASTHRSGCGIRPTTLPVSFATPAMFAREPFGFAPALPTPHSST